MPASRTQRRLAAILAADVVGYSRLMEADEAGTLANLKAIRSGLVDPKMTAYGGHIVKLMGDGALVEFPSVVDAVACAIDIQEAVARRNVGIADERRIVFRVGINLGDIMVEAGDLYGDGVNLAARLEQLAEPGGIAISGTVREHVEGKLDARFADGGEQRVKGLARPVHVYRWSPLAGTAALASGTQFALPDKPSIAVLPFNYLSGDPAQEHVTDGLTEDVITLLSRVRWLFVIARNSSFTYKGRAVDAQQVAEELGVRYVLEGSVRTAADRIRVSAQLIDAPTRAQVWAERYDRELEDIFDLQDEITEAIVGAVEPELGNVERERARHRPTDSLDAWSAYQRGLWHIYRFREEDAAEALRLFEHAITLDPDFGPAYAGKSLCHSFRVFIDACDRPEDELETAYEAAKRSVALDERDPFAHWALARAHFWRNQHEQAIAELGTALSLNPSFAQAHFLLGWVLAYASRPEEALLHLDKAFRLSPHDPFMMGIMSLRSVALMLMGRLDEALQWARDSARHPVAHFHSRAGLVSILGDLGRIDEAKAVLAEILRDRPDYSCALIERTFPFKHRKDLERFLGGLRKAGLPE